MLSVISKNKKHKIKPLKKFKLFNYKHNKS